MNNYPYPAMQICNRPAEEASRALITIPPNALTRLRRHASSQHIPLATLCQTAWAIVQWAYEGADGERIVYGATVSGRSSATAGLGDVIGPVVNTVPLVLELSAEMPLHQLSHHVFQISDRLGMALSLTPHSQEPPWVNSTSGWVNSTCTG